MPTGLTLYHRTDAADLITAHGFADGHGTYLTGAWQSGVFLSDYPLECSEGAEGDQLIRVTIPDEADVADYEWIEEGKPYREWCIPAAIVNRYPGPW